VVARHRVGLIEEEPTLKILDLTAGSRGIWFEKTYPDAVFVDIRPEMKPDWVADSGALPFDDSDFDLIVFDPPHVNSGANSNTTKCYGHYTAAQIRDFVLRASREAHRVSRADALMAFKWNDHDQKLGTILDLMKAWWEPLFGAKTSTRTKHSSSTQWIMLRRCSLT
jgi:hypothetical protein